MRWSLIREVERRRIPIHENRLSVLLLTIEAKSETRVAGAIVLNGELDAKDIGNGSSVFEVCVSEKVVFATGGPETEFLKAYFSSPCLSALG
jgi:hypothetical protein